MGDREVIMELERIERLAKERGNKLYGIYLRLTPRNSRKADEILDKMASGEITYDEALKRLRELYRRQRAAEKRRRRKR